MRKSQKPLPVPHPATSIGLKKAFHRKLLSCSVEKQRALTAVVVPNDRDSWTHGVGAETIYTLTRAFKGRPGNHHLYLGADLRVLCESLDDIRAAVKVLRAANVTIHDLSHPDQTDIIDMLATAQKGMRWNGDRRHQKNKGRKGGNAKAANAEAKRNAIMNRDAVIRMKYHPKLTLQDCADILGAPFSKQTLARHY